MLKLCVEKIQTQHTLLFTNKIGAKLSLVNKKVSFKNKKAK